MDSKNNSAKKNKLKVKPLKWTLMELRKMNFLRRKNLPIPKELLEKKFENFDLNDSKLIIVEVNYFDKKADNKEGQEDAKKTKQRTSLFKSNINGGEGNEENSKQENPKNITNNVTKIPRTQLSNLPLKELE